MNNLYTAKRSRSHRFFKIHIIIDLQISLINKKGFDKV